MTLLHSGALWGLLSILVLILFSFWRQRPTQVGVPNVGIWSKVPDSVPPLDELKRPTLNAMLLIQALAVAALFTGIAGPGIPGTKPEPRKIGVVWDLSAPMALRLDKAREEIKKLDASDRIVIYESPSLRRHEGLADLASMQPVNRMGDPKPALDLAASESTIVLWVSDRSTTWKAPAGVTLHQVLVGGAAENTGILDAIVDSGKLFLRLSRPADVSLSIDGVASKLLAGTVTAAIPDSATRIEASLAPDVFPADDRVVLTRSREPIDVGFEGRLDPAVRAALEANPRARIVKGAAPHLLVRIETDPVQSPARFVVDLEPHGPEIARWVTPGAISVVDAELAKIPIAPEELKFREVGELAGEWDRVLFSQGGKPFAAIRGNRLVMAARSDSSGWPLNPSFPIFWTYVLEYAARGAGSWQAQGLLDASATALGTESRTLDPATLGERARVETRVDLTTAAIVLAILFMLWAWRIESAGRNAE